MSDFHWLTTSQTMSLITNAREILERSDDILHALKWLRKDLSPERAAQVIEQARLQRRAKTKFTLAEEMLFTKKGLE